MRRFVLPALAIAVVALAGGAATPIVSAATSQAVANPRIEVAVPRRASRNKLTAIQLTLPRSVAALDGRVLFAKGAAKLVGIAIYGPGRAIRPVAIKGGFAFGAYNLRPSRGRVLLDLVVLPKRNGRLQARVVVDATSGQTGKRLTTVGSRHVATIGVGRERRLLAAAAPATSPAPGEALAEPRDLIPDGRIGRGDVDVARAAWEQARAKGAVCGSATARRGDANGDGCADIVDVQATLASIGRRVARPGGQPRVPRRIAAAALRTFVVRSTADTADVSPGNGVCSDSEGRCTLRAAMAEADYLPGEDRIEFDLPGAAPATIQITRSLPIIASRGGGVTIDGYSQPGARTNDATYGSNAIPGVELRGNGMSAREWGFFITSSDNVIRGLAFRNLYRGIFVDGQNAHHNRILGNWVGYSGSGANSGSGQYGIVINVGAHDNVVGTPDLADRNVIGNWNAGIDLYGPGVDGNVIRNNLFCIRPDGGTAPCAMGIDHNFGPKNNVFGGDDNDQRNVIGPTSNQGIELSHGWDPQRVDTTTKWQINNNTVTGNWVGFRANGAYDLAYRSGYNTSGSDNGNGINVYDGTNDNVIQRNYVSSRIDGIQVMAPNAQRNVFRGNVIGESPLGEPAPLGRWGIVVRWGTSFDEIRNNTIRNATAGGIGMVLTGNNGAAMAPATNVMVSRNIVTNTSGPAISAPAALVSPPVIESASTSTVSGTAVDGAVIEVYRASRDVGESGLPVEFLGDTVAQGGTWSVDVSGVQQGDRVTALQIRQDLNTSELSANLLVGEAPPPPAPGDLLASDDFERSFTDGWGDAVSGETWGHAGHAGSFSVSGGLGHIDVAAGQAREARLTIGEQDVAVTGRVTLDRLANTGNLHAYVLARVNGDSAYRATIRIAPSGAVFVQLKRAINGVESNIAPEVPAGFSVTPGSAIAFRLRVVGTELLFRAWDASTAEPGWLTTASDTTPALQGALGVGLRTYTGSKVTNGPVHFTLDDFEVRIPT